MKYKNTKLNNIFKIIFNLHRKSSSIYTGKTEGDRCVKFGMKL